MADKKLNDNEIGAFIEAFAESRDSNISPHAQSQTFKYLIIFINLYVFGTLALYGLFRSDLLQVIDPFLSSSGSSALLDGRAQIFFWGIVLLNISLYFNFGFRLLCIILGISLSNSTLDYFVLSPGIFSFDERPYFSIYFAFRPLLIFATFWLAASYKDGILSN